MKNKIKNTLLQFQTFYSNKNPDDIDSFMKQFFYFKGFVNVVGTSNTEILTSFTDVKDLIHGDWLYWGDLKLDVDHFSYREVGNNIIAIVPSTLSFSFVTNEDSDTAYLNFIKETLQTNPTSSYQEIEYKQLFTNYILDHYLCDRVPKKRWNHYPILLVFLFQYESNNLKIHSLTFTHPPQGLYPDKRVHPYTGFDTVQKESHQKYAIRAKDNPFPPLNSMPLSKNLTFIDVNQTVYEGDTAKSMYHQFQSYYNKLSLQEDHVVYNSNGNITSITYIGAVTKILSPEEARIQLQSKIESILQSNLTKREQLFSIRRDISICNKELSLGDTHIWPIRLFVIISDGEIELIQVGYPMHEILEDKYV